MNLVEEVIIGNIHIYTFIYILKKKNFQTPLPLPLKCSNFSTYAPLTVLLTLLEKKNKIKKKGVKKSH